MKITSFILTVALLFFFMNCREKKSEKQNNLLALVNGTEISVNHIDSLIAGEIFKIKRNALNKLIEKELLNQESKRLHVSVSSLIEKEVTNKTELVTPDDFSKYLEINDIRKEDIDSIMIMSYLQETKRRESEIRYIEELKSKSKIEILLTPKYYRTVSLDSIYSYNISKGGNIFVYIISDFNCPSCQSIEEQLLSIINKYQNQVSFKFVYYSNYIDKSILACHAAMEQNKFFDMYKLVFENIGNLQNESDYQLLAQDLNLNLDAFNNDFSNMEIIKLHSLNSEKLGELGIFSTPSFVVNNKLIDSKNSIEFLEQVIKNEIISKQ
jgi:predicted DsbA family dithiol-disulfide isomerase